MNKENMNIRTALSEKALLDKRIDTLSRKSYTGIAFADMI